MLLACVKDIAETVQALVVSVAAVVAGFWTWLLFVRHRLAYPKVALEITVGTWRLEPHSRLVHAEVRISNRGDVILRSNRAELRLRQVLPVPEQVSTAVHSGYDPVPAGRAEVEWPMVAGREWKWEDDEFEIEPREPDTLQADFVVPADVQVAEFYFFLSNPKKKNQNLGWTLTKFYDFTGEKEVLMAPEGQAHDRSEKKPQPDHLQEQQKQQRPQQQQQPKQPKEPGK